MGHTMLRRQMADCNWVREITQVSLTTVDYPFS